MYLRYVHSFRAVAIVVIVAGHAVFHLDWAPGSRTEDLLLDLLDNGTVLFVFVAGFLFHHLAARYRYRDYLAKKMTNVLLPYLLVSIPAILITVLFVDATRDNPELVGTSQGYQAVWLLVKGGGTFLYSLWFIPMIALFYLAAPLFMQFVRHPRWYAVLVVLVPLSMFAHRSDELDTVTIALYFLPAYIAGMAASQHRERLEILLDRHWVALTAGFLGSVVAMFLLLDHHGNYYGAAPFSQEHHLVDWMFAQKLLLCFALLAMLRRLDLVLGDRLRYLGDISFTIFFAHGYLLFAVLFAYKQVFDALPPGNLATWLALSVGVVAGTAGATVLAKRTLGRRSRYLIGS
jgi:surface polysaccharide O-acyltransferase-like enzyme